MYINNDRMRFSGLSGIDTESMLQKIMEAQRRPVYALKKNKQLLEWKRDDYRDVNRKLLELRDLARDMRYTTSYSKKAVSSSIESVAKVTAGSNAMNGGYTLEVTSLASSAALTSASPMGLKSGNIDPITHKINQTGSDVTFTITGEKGSADITVTSEDTIYNFITKINEATGTTGVQVNFDKDNDRLFFQSTAQGSNAKIEFSGTGTSWVEDTFKLSSLSAEGTDANIKLNNIDMQFNSNNFSVNGLTISLKSNGTTNLSVSNDVDGIYENINKFVDKYNEVIELLNGKVSEKKNNKLIFPTDEEKEKMSAKDFELWEKNAKVGMLERDPVISKYLTQFRTDFNTPLATTSSDFDSMFDIGLSTGDWREKGKIMIDEAKLKEAIANNPEKVMNIFIAYSEEEVQDPNDANNTITRIKHNDSGIAQRLFYSIDAAINAVSEKVGKDFNSGQGSITKDISNLTRKIEDFEKKMIKIENRYIMQFTAMEKAIQKANMQSSWLMSQGG